MKLIDAVKEADRVLAPKNRSKLLIKQVKWLQEHVYDNTGYKLEDELIRFIWRTLKPDSDLNHKVKEVDKW